MPLKGNWNKCMKISKCKLIMIKENEIDSKPLNNAKDIHDFLINKVKLHNEPEEVVIMLALDNKNNVNGYFEVSRGSISMSLLSPREVFKRALTSNAKSIVVAHNHISGDVSPSIQDEVITKALIKAGEILDIKLLDHIIVSEKDYYSFFENKNERIKNIEKKKESYERS